LIGEDVAEFAYRPTACRTTYRVIGQVPPPPDQFCATTSRSVRGNLD
jgi:hypothetical protein